MKQNAKGCLKRHWGSAMGTFFVFAMIYLLRTVMEEVVRLVAGIPLEMEWNAMGFLGGFPDTLRFVDPTSLGITTLFIFVGLLILSPLTLGIQRYYWNLAGDEPSGIGCIFDFYSSSALYLRSVMLNLRIALRTLVTGVALQFPAVVLLGFGLIFRDGSFGFIKSEGLSEMLLSFAGLAAFCGLLILFVYAQRFFLAGYFAAADDGLELTDAIEYSAAWMHGHKLRLTGFYFSFLPWFLLCILVLPVLFVYPYVNTALAGFAREVVRDHHARKEAFKKPMEVYMERNEA